MKRPITFHKKVNSNSFKRKKEQSLRTMKEKQLKEQEEKRNEEKARNEVLLSFNLFYKNQRIKAQQREIGRNPKDISKKNITYDYFGNPMAVNPIHADKQHNVVISSMYNLEILLKKEQT